MPKEWKQAKAVTKPLKLTGNQLLRSVGYGDRFFTLLARFHLKVQDAKLVGPKVRVKLQGAMGCTYSQVIELNTGNAGEDTITATRGTSISALLEQAHQIIAQHNPSIRKAPAVTGTSGRPVRNKPQHELGGYETAEV